MSKKSSRRGSRGKSAKRAMKAKRTMKKSAAAGAALESTFRLFRAARAANRYKTDPTPVKAQQVQQANEKLETAIDQLRQTTEQQISPRPPVAAPEPVEPRTAVQPMGNVAAAAIEPPTAPRPQPTPVEPEAVDPRVKLVRDLEAIDAPAAPKAAPAPPSAAEEITDNVIAAVAAPKTAVQPMGNVAAAAIEPPTTGFALPAELIRSAPRYNYGSKAFQLQFASDYDKTAYILAGDAVKASKAAPKFRTALEQAGLDVGSAVAYGQRVRDAIKALARNSQPGVINLPDQGGLTGKTRDEIRLAAAEKTGNTQLAAELRARIAGTNPLDTLRSRGPELPELPKKPGLTREEIDLQIAEIEQLIADIESDTLNMQVDEPRTRALAEELTKDIRTVAGDEVAIRFNNAFMETKGGDVRDEKRRTELGAGVQRYAD